MGYRLLARLEVDQGKLEREALPAGEALGRYKDQGRTVERGFRFLKDPLFFTGGAFPKRPERVMALGMVMALALLVYALAKDPPCAGCSGSSSGCAWWSWRAGPWSSTWPPITRPRCACWGHSDITSWSEGGAECGFRRLKLPLEEITWLAKVHTSALPSALRPIHQEEDLSLPSTPPTIPVSAKLGLGWA